MISLFLMNIFVTSITNFMSHYTELMFISQAVGKDGGILLEFLWRETKSRQMKTQKYERGKYPDILTEKAWSIKDLSYG